MRTNATLSIFVVGLIAFGAFSSAAQTENISTMLGVRARGMGGAFRAVANSYDAMYYNPAGLGQFARFEVSADYLFKNARTQNLVGATLIDSTSSPLSAGLDFHVSIGNQAVDNIYYMGSFALAYELAPEILYVGALLEYDYIPKTQTDPLISAFTGDVGILVRPGLGISFAAVGYNLIPSESKRLATNLGLGAALNFGGMPVGAQTVQQAYSGFTLAADYLMIDLVKQNPLKHEVSAGAEYMFLEVVPLRFGYTYAVTDNTHSIMAGGGFLADQAELTASYEHNLSDTNDFSIGVVLKLFL